MSIFGVTSEYWNRLGMNLIILIARMRIKIVSVAELSEKETQPSYIEISW